MGEFSEVVPDNFGRWAIDCKGVFDFLGFAYKNKDDAEEHSRQINSAAEAFADARVKAALERAAKEAMGICDCKGNIFHTDGCNTQRPREEVAAAILRLFDGSREKGE